MDKSQMRMSQLMQQQFQCTWKELEYHLGICCMAHAAHVEHMQTWSASACVSSYLTDVTVLIN